jgi:DNA-binding NarL/FixJ family response regulator
MLIDHPEIKATRANIFNWMRERGMTAEQPANQEAMRAYLQESVPAVIHKNGLYLQTLTGSQYKTIHFVRYSTSAPEGLSLMSKVKSSGHRQRVEVFINKENPSEVWLATSAGLIMWTWQVDEQDYEHRNYWDLLNIASRMSLDSSLNEETALSHNIQTQTRRKQVLNSAIREKKLALGESGTKPTQSIRAKNLKENTSREIEILRAVASTTPVITNVDQELPAALPTRRLSASELMRKNLLGK